MKIGTTEVPILGSRLYLGERSFHQPGVLERAESGLGAEDDMNSSGQAHGDLPGSPMLLGLRAGRRADVLHRCPA